MEDSTVREFKISYLQYEYNRYSRLICSEVQHIENLARLNLISIQQRHNSLNQINHLIRCMNQDIYNTKLKELKAPITLDEIKLDDCGGKFGDEFQEIDDTPLFSSDLRLKSIQDIIGLGNTNIDVLFDICRSGNNIGSMGNIMFNDFNKICDKIIRIGNEIGFKSIYCALELLIGYGHQDLIKDNIKDNLTKDTDDDDNNSEKDKLKEFREMLSLINECFIPMKFTSITNDGNNFHIKCSINDQFPNELFLQPYATIEICFPNNDKIFQFEGYFQIDPIQCLIRTCQIGRRFLYEKKKALQTIVDELKSGSINTKFSNIYIKNISIGEILSYTKEQFIAKLNSDFKKYTKLSKMTFINLMDEFTKESQSNLRNMFTIIRLLLLGPDDCINMAGLLFGLTKDKKIGSEFVADTIYNNLSLPFQQKLKKSAINIKNELDKIKNLTDDEVPPEKVIASNPNIPTKIKKIILNKLGEMKTQTAETAKNKILVDILSRFPWNPSNDFTEMVGNNSCLYMDNVMKVLNDKIYGHKECKEAIKELVCSWILNPSRMGKAIALYGPPGVGKTLIAKALGDAIGVPVQCLSLCGMEDAAVLTGHSSTYSGAQPGIIIREMCEAGKSRCILFFDEVDKTCKRHNINEIQNVLINLTDPNMNMKFNDKFFQETSFDLSKVICIFTYNDRSSIDPVLLNRLHEIEVKPYTVKDKIKICRDYLLKEILEQMNLEYKSILITDVDIKFIAENYTYESGVRELRRKVETILLKLCVDKIYHKGQFLCKCKQEKLCTCDKCGSCDKCKECLACATPCTRGCKVEINKENPITLTRDTISKYLGKPKLHLDKIQPYSGVGIVNGLYATNSGGGGGLVTIVAQKTNSTSSGKFELKLTGSQGKVMKESVNFALATVENLIKKEIVTDFYSNNRGISVHALDGATSKDGPSAGCAFAVVLISLITGLKIKNTVAMTGEIGICGEAKAIGGLISKLYGAKKAGALTVFIPQENIDDFDEIMKQDPEICDNNFKVLPVNSIYEILPHIFVEEFDINNYLNPRIL